MPLLNVRAGLPQGTELALFEEIKPNLVERLADLDRPLEKVSLPLCILMLNYVKGYQTCANVKLAALGDQMFQE